MCIFIVLIPLIWEYKNNCSYFLFTNNLTFIILTFNMNSNFDICINAVRITPKPRG